MKNEPNELDAAREKIDRADAAMRDLFLERMAAAREVAAYKEKHGLPTLDAGREEELIARNAGEVEDEVLRDLYVRFLKNNMALSRAYQEQLRKK